MPIISSERITQAREFHGLTKSALAEQLNVTPAAVAQWEDGTKTPSPENLAALAEHLHVPIAFLVEASPTEMQRRGPLTFRAWSTAQTRRTNRKAERLAEMVAETYMWIAARIQLPPPGLPEIEFDLEDRASIESAATKCRRAWGLGDRPILKLGELLESKGIIVVSASFCDNRIDAFSCVTNGRPFIFLGDEKQDRARTRFDSGHELGHILRHQHLSEEELHQKAVHERIEAEANAFASAFLMPAETFGADIMEVSLDHFLRIKSKWGVSAQAMIRRSRDLGIIDPDTYAELFRQAGMRGWRRPRGEPFDELVPVTRGSLGEKSLKILEANGLVQAWELPAQLPLPVSVLSKVFGRDLAAEEPSEFGKIIPFLKPNPNQAQSN